MQWSINLPMKTMCWLILFLVLLPAYNILAATDVRDSDSPFGTLEFLEYNHDWNHYQYDTPEKLEKAASLMEEAGVKFVRLTFSWMDIEPARDNFTFDKYDRLVSLVTRHHMKILSILAFNATYEGQWNDPPDEGRYLAFVRKVVHRYKDRIKYWEIWNEPDLPLYWTQQDDLKRYTHLLKAVYPVIKKEDPTGVVVLGGLTDSAPMSLGYIYANGGKGSFDIMNMHPFVNPLDPKPLEEMGTIFRHVRIVMERNGDGAMPIWLTELSCPGMRKGVVSKGWFGYLGRTPTEEEQAKWVRTVYGTVLKWKGVQKIFWAGFRETNDSFHDDVDYFGLLRNDFSKKPAFEAYQRMARSKV